MATAFAEAVATKAVRGRFPTQEIDATQGLTPRVERLKERYLAVKCQVIGDRARYMMESFKETEGEHLAIRRAKAFANVLA